MTLYCFDRKKLKGLTLAEIITALGMFSALASLVLFKGEGALSSAQTEVTEQSLKAFDQAVAQYGQKNYIDHPTTKDRTGLRFGDAVGTTAIATLYVATPAWLTTEQCDKGDCNALLAAQHPNMNRIGDGAAPTIDANTVAADTWTFDSAVRGMAGLGRLVAGGKINADTWGRAFVAFIGGCASAEDQLDGSSAYNDLACYFCSAGPDGVLSTPSGIESTTGCAASSPACANVDFEDALAAARSGTGVGDDICSLVSETTASPENKI